MVCLEDYDRPVALVPCGHAACRHCWLATVGHGAGDTCPACREHVERFVELFL